MSKIVCTCLYFHKVLSESIDLKIKSLFIGIPLPINKKGNTPASNTETEISPKFRIKIMKYKAF